VAAELYAQDVEVEFEESRLEPKEVIGDLVELWEELEEAARKKKDQVGEEEDL
jgi:hypothetical protein